MGAVLAHSFWIPDMVASTKHDRVVHANQLIQVIAAHGRRFFYCKSQDTYARIELDARGRVWFVDDYTQQRFYTHHEGRWSGFSHGGTLRGLVECMRDYITRGEQIGRWRIGTHWGYSEASLDLVKSAAFSLPIIARDPSEPRDYYVISVHHTRRDHRYVTLWAPDNKGYVFRAYKAGRYAEDGVREKLGYYNDGCSNIAVPCDIVDPLTIMTTPADQLDGADGPALLNTRDSWKMILANVIAAPKYKPWPLYKGAPLSDYERASRGLPKRKEAV
ncbi:hypothetical protein AAGS40_23415 [Paraburkholderia sp. PREW-6R]|uniref:hypothetical protein n=1 Tax=Paraburkholderia sp. PREW-6R TaxID=3141544 RepID=UPI0031F48753